MRAIILAAGRGERMRPLTDRVPKPLMRVGGATLLDWQVRRLVAAGVRDIVVNVSHLAESIVASLGDGSRLGARVEYSHEPVALETAGGIVQALHLLGEGAFVVVNADIFCDYDLTEVLRAANRLDSAGVDWLAHVILVDNPAHHPQGDFVLDADGRVGADVGADVGARLTFSGIAVYRAALFADIHRGERHALAPLLYAAARCGRVYGAHYRGRWIDVGTPERLAQLRALVGDAAPDAHPP